MPALHRRIAVLGVLASLVLLSPTLFPTAHAPTVAIQTTVLQLLSEKIPIQEYAFYSHPSTCRGGGRDRLSGVGPGLIDDFVRQNNPLQAQPGELLLTGTDYHLVSRQDSRRLYAGASPELRDIPRQLINVSRIGFTADMAEALICIETEESGDLVYLRKTDQDWRVQQWLYIW